MIAIFLLSSSFMVLLLLMVLVFTISTKKDLFTTRLKVDELGKKVDDTQKMFKDDVVTILGKFKDLLKK